MNIFIIIATVIVSVIAWSDANVFYRLKFNPYYIKHYRQWYRFFTGGLIHADVVHLSFNMFTLWIFGDYAETFFKLLFHEAGAWIYLLFYVLAIPMSSLYSFERHKNDEWYNAVGASGAVSAVLFCFIIQEPFAKIGIILIPIGIPAIVFGGLYLFYSWYMARRGADNIGHDAHFFGALFGILVTVISAPTLVLDMFQKLVP